jgi:hypothetical protein
MKAKIPMGDEDAYTYSGVAGFSFGSFPNVSDMVGIKTILSNWS